MVWHSQFHVGQSVDLGDRLRPGACSTPHILEARQGEPTRQVDTYDLRTRRLIDTEITRRAIAFIRRSAGAGQPFFCYVPFTLVHYPTLPHPDFAGKTGNGNWADCLAEMDFHVGQIVDVVDELKLAGDTLIVFCSDNGPEEAQRDSGWAGPWSGSYFTAMEGSLRVPFILRWPNRVAAGRISNEIVHQVDIFATFGRLAGAALPTDRIIDGVDQLDFFLGRKERSNREGFPATSVTPCTR